MAMTLMTELVNNVSTYPSYISVVTLTMCLAANTPSTIAQQKAATTPKLMKTIDATNWKRHNTEEHQTSSFVTCH